MSKYSEVSSTTEVNASAPCSVEFGLKANFPDDKGQTYLAQNIPFKARTLQGIVDGTLDANGEVIIKDAGIGAVTIKVLPNVDKEIAELRASIKSALDTVIAQERAYGKALADTYNKQDNLDKALVNVGAGTRWTEYHQRHWLCHRCSSRRSRRVHLRPSQCS